MNLVRDDLEHVVVVPACACRVGCSTAAAPGDKVEGELAQEGEVAGGGAIAHAAIVIAEGDVEHSVQRGLDAPVPADGPDQDGGLITAAGEKVADLGFGLAGAVDAADRLSRQQRAEIEPACWWRISR